MVTNKELIAFAEAMTKDGLESWQVQLLCSQVGKNVIANARQGCKPRMQKLFLDKYVNNYKECGNFPFRDLIEKITTYSPYCKPAWIGGYLGWVLGRREHPEANCYIGAYISDCEELEQSTWLEF